MADHRAEQILAVVATKLTGLATTGTKVTRGRVYDLPANKLPHLSIYRGGNLPADGADQNISVADWLLEVRVEVIVKATTTLDTLLAQIEKEVTVALKADRTQGASFVIDTIEQGSLEPDLDAGGDQPTATMVMGFLIKYRRSLGDPSQ